MGIIKGDRLSESDKLAECSLVAAGFYGLFVSNSEITDDFGRFRLFPELLLAKAFAKRLEKGKRDVTAGKVREWFAEYERVGLIKTWEYDGSKWAEWTNWQAKPQSKRRFHRAPEPPHSTHEHSALCSQSGSRWAAVRQPGGSRPAAGGAPSPFPPYSPSTDPPTPPSPPGSDTARPAAAWSAGRADRQRRQESREKADELARYRDRLGNGYGAKPTTNAQKAIWRRALESGAYTPLQLQGSISEGLWSELRSAGRLAPDAPWPPPGLAPYDAHAPPDASPEGEAEGQQAGMVGEGVKA